MRMRPVVLLLLATLMAGGCKKKKETPLEPPPLPPEIAGDLSPARTTSQEAQRDPQRFIVGTWQVDPRGTLDANADQPSNKLEVLKRNILPGMAGVVVTYDQDGTTSSAAQGRAPNVAQWSVVKVDAPSITLKVLAKGEEPVTTTLEVMDANHIKTVFNGVTMVLQRSGGMPMEPRTADLPVGRGPGGRGGTQPRPAAAGYRGAAPLGSAAQPQDTTDLNQRMDAENQRIRDHNRQTAMHNQGGPLYVNQPQGPAPSNDTSNRDALLADPNLPARQRAQLERNKRVEERNQRLTQEKAPLHVR